MTQRPAIHRQSLHRLVFRFLFSTLVLLSACELFGGAGPISRKIGTLARESEAREVDIAQLTDFGWDRMYLFQTGTSRADVCEELGVASNYCERVVRNESRAGESMTLAFTLGDRLTHVELHMLENGQLDWEVTPLVLDRTAAVFKVIRSDHPDSKTTIRLERK